MGLIQQAGEVISHAGGVLGDVIGGFGDDATQIEQIAQ